MASLKLNGFCCIVCLVLGVLILLPSSSTAALASHYETYTYQVAIGNWHCYDVAYTYCYNWWYWNYWKWGRNWYPYRYYYGYYCSPWYGCGWNRWCNTRTQRSCYYYYTYQTVTAQRCQAGWIGSQCNIPTCTPSCATGMICVDLNICGCADGSASGNCQLLPCSPQLNCYPGTCVSGSCKCPPGFSGPNCINFDIQPVITSCSVKLFAKPTPASTEIQVALADCAAPGLTPGITWINGPLLNPGAADLGLTRIEPIWTASYTFPTVMPEKPNGVSTFFIRTAPVPMGVYDGSYNISFPDSTFTTSPQQCAYPNLKTTLPNTAKCDNPTDWASLNVQPLIGHNKTIVVQMSAVLGGTKTGDGAYSLNGNTYGFGNQLFVGTPVVVRSMLKFDLRPPTHCILLQAGSVTPGQDRINCTLFPIYLDQDIRTNPVIKPMFLDWSDDGSGIQKFHVEVFYMQPDVSGQQLEPNGSPLTDSVADVTPQVSNYQFTVPTPGVYSIVVTAYDYANNSATARKIFNYMNLPSYSITNSPVFIREANSAANYSFITSLTNLKQLTLDWTGRFQANELYGRVLSKRVRPLPINQYTVDDIYGSQFGQRSINAVDNQTGISSFTVSYLVDSKNGGLTALPSDTNVTAPINGETATLTFDEPLQDGDTVVVWLNATGSTGNQTTYQLNVGFDTTRPNVSSQSFIKNGIDQYTSSVNIAVYDHQSGINSTTYYVVDKLSDTVILKEQTVPPITRLAPDRKKRDPTGLQTICSASDTTCYCTPSEQCFLYMQTIVIDNCMLDRFSGSEFKLVLHYTISNMAGLQISNSIQLGDLSGITCIPVPEPPVLTPGAIAGIVIGCFIGFLLLIVLIIFIVVIIIRIRQHQNAIPTRKELRTMAGNVRNRLTFRRERQNEVYTAGPQVGASNSKQFSKNNNAYIEDDTYGTDDLDSFKISKKLIQLADVLAEGKFAVIRKAFYIKANSKETVATKALKNGFSQKDELLMTKKVVFMKNVPPHGNLVHFIGFVDESDGQGPIMILELCDYPLKDWLANLSNISTDDLELMLNFTLNIAQGVAHLHTHKIIHRRLAVRNVLVKQQANGLVAKLIGFGPTAEDEKDVGVGTGVTVPLKWMAPETLDSMNSTKPVYNEKTDAWSYGVTVWEIYSKGAGPYPDVKSSDIKSQVKRGLRLKCPSDCPPELFSTAVQPCWNEKADRRPTFDVIVQNVQRFRNGTERPQSGYYGTDEVHGGQKTYTNQRGMYDDVGLRN